MSADHKAEWWIGAVIALAACGFMAGAGALGVGLVVGIVVGSIAAVAARDGEGKGIGFAAGLPIGLVVGWGGALLLAFVR